MAKQYSIDEATKSTGGLRQGVVQGQSEPQLDRQIFSSPEGELVGPFKGDSGFYVIQVEKMTPEVTQSITDASQQIRQTLAAQQQQEIAQNFQTNFQNKWVSRTFCADGYRIDRCANAEPPPPTCTEQVLKTTGCEAFAPPRGVFDPGTQGVFGSAPPTIQPQGPPVHHDGDGRPGPAAPGPRPRQPPRRAPCPRAACPPAACRRAGAAGHGAAGFDADGRRRAASRRR